jgi:hypothetical protein
MKRCQKNHKFCKDWAWGLIEVDFRLLNIGFARNTANGVCRNKTNNNNNNNKNVLEKRATKKYLNRFGYNRTQRIGWGLKGKKRVKERRGKGKRRGEE